MSEDLTDITGRHRSLAAEVERLRAALALAEHERDALRQLWVEHVRDEADLTDLREDADHD